MTKYHCKACGGEYTPDQPGSYFHVCPAYRLIKKGPGAPNVEPGDSGEYKDVTKTLQYTLILNRRNENVDDSDPEHPKIKAEGEGRETVLEAEAPP